MRSALIALTLLCSVALAADPAPAAPAPAPAPAPALRWATGFSTPESVLYDAASDSVLVSNINGKPTDKDNNGYITELAPDGSVRTARLVEGGKNGATLNAPKGFVIKDGLIYVADIDTVRIFDRATGAPRGEIAVAGASFLNDVALSPAGEIYVSDSGLSPSFEPTGSDAIYRLKLGATPSVEAVVKSTDLHGPNGLLVTADSIHVVSFGTPELQTYDLKGQKKSTVNLPNGGLDGIVALGGDVLVSSWGAKAIYRGKPGGPFTAVINNVEAPADFGYDTKRGRLLLPRFMASAVEIWEIK